MSQSGTFATALDEHLTQFGDLETVSGDAANGEAFTIGGLIIAILGTDRRADPSELYPGADDPGGWWGDDFGGRNGSKLWLLRSEPVTDNVARRAEAYTVEAFQPFVTLGLFTAVEATGTASGGVLGLAINLKRPDGSYVSQEFADLWAAFEEQ